VIFWAFRKSRQVCGERRNHQQLRLDRHHALAKGLEFRAVAVMACDDEIMPLQERIETVGEDADLQEVYDTERHLLYVAAREPEITYSSRVLNRRPNFSMICGCEPHLLVFDEVVSLANSEVTT
jgi:hypothetical protein